MSEILSNGTENNSLHNIDHCISIYVSYGIRKGPFAIFIEYAMLLNSKIEKEHFFFDILRKYQFYQDEKHSYLYIVSK